MTAYPADVIAKMPRLRARLEASASGYIRTTKLSVPDRTVLSAMIEMGEAEIFESPLGRAYRLKQCPEHKVPLMKSRAGVLFCTACSAEDG